MSEWLSRFADSELEVIYIGPRSDRRSCVKCGDRFLVTLENQVLTTYAVLSSSRFIHTSVGRVGTRGGPLTNRSG